MTEEFHREVDWAHYFHETWPEDSDCYIDDMEEDSNSEMSCVDIDVCFETGHSPVISQRYCFSDSMKAIVMISIKIIIISVLASK